MRNCLVDALNLLLICVSAEMLLLSLAVMCDMDSFFLSLVANLEVATLHNSLDRLVVLDTVKFLVLGGSIVQFVLVSAPVDRCHAYKSLMSDVVCACESGLGCV